MRRAKKRSSDSSNKKSDIGVRVCGTDAYHKRLLELKGERYRINRQRHEEFVLRYMSSATISKTQSEPIPTIPVVVHVVYNTPQQNIPDEQIHSQIRILNHDYRKLNTDSVRVPTAFKPLAADARIEFKLACIDPDGNSTTGITRTTTSLSSFEIPPEGSPPEAEKIKFTSEGGKDVWDTTRYLNLWICSLGKTPTGDQLLGYAQFPDGPPETDGVVIHYSAFGDTGTARAPFNLGRTATHEIGHYLGLYHIWGDDQFLSNPCSGTDNVEDTPNQARANGGKPSFPETSNACPDTGPNGTMFMNYMDYTDDDSMYMFTIGQVTRMDATLAESRTSILNSNTLVCPGEEAHAARTRRLPSMVYNAVDSIVKIENLL